MILHFWRCRRAGFTLIEIMIVIAIIAILAVLVIPNFAEARARARFEKCKQNILAIAKAMEMASVRHNLQDISSWEDGVDYGYSLPAKLAYNGYLDKLPKCDVTGNNYRGTVTTYTSYKPETGWAYKYVATGYYLECGIDLVGYRREAYHRVKGVYVRPVFRNQQTIQLNSIRTGGAANNGWSYTILGDDYVGGYVPSASGTAGQSHTVYDF